MRKLILIILLAAFSVAALPGEAAVVTAGVSSSGKTWRTVSKKQKKKHKKHQKRKKYKAHAKKRSEAPAK